MVGKRRSDPLIVEALEPRILYSADSPLGVAVALMGQPEESVASSYTTPAAATPTQVTTSEQEVRQRTEIVLIDSAVPGAEDLVSQILAGNTGPRTLEVFVLEAGKDGIDQIGTILGMYRNLDAVHIISHGEDGALQLGDTRLDGQSLLSNAVAVSKWGSSLTDDGDILLYGCDVAATQEGLGFVSALGQLTGADINASVNKTGAANLAGDWTLEHALGRIDSVLAVSASVQAQFDSILATYTVTNTNDSGAGSLRQAITDANANAGADTINFSIGSGVQTISVASVLPIITDVVTIDGTTQSGFASAPLIEIDGTAVSADATANGLRLSSTASGSTIKSLIINRFGGHGIFLNGTSNVTITGSYIGTDSTGMVASANGKSGIELDGTASNNTIGGLTASERNVLSGNTQNGIRLAGSDSNLIQGNYIGVNAAGDADLGNAGTGVYIENSSSTTVGGTVAGAGNVISGNDYDGIDIDNSTGTLVQGNYIGLNAAGDAAIGNFYDGVWINNGSTNNTIGGSTSGARNVISGNDANGVNITGVSGNFVQGNYIGTNAAGDAAIGNAFGGIYLDIAGANTIGGTGAGEGNVISGNVSDGIAIQNATGSLIQGNYIGLNANGDGVLGNGGNGIYIWNGSTGNTIGGSTSSARNVISGNGTSGIYLDGSTSNSILGNYIGVNPAGAAAFANGGNGISLEASSNNNTIGGTAAGERNILSGNGSNGIEIVSSTGNTILGNYIGLNATGDAAIANTDAGIYLNWADDNTIGGSAAGAGNVISGNNDVGIKIDGSARAIILGNYIGTDKTGTVAIGNSYGIMIWNVTDTTIGGSAAGEANVISGNDTDGLNIQQGSGLTIQGNYIGTNASGDALGNASHGIFLYLDAANNVIGGTAAGEGNVIAYNNLNGISTTNSTTVTGNQILGNSVYSNGWYGIDLQGDNPTTNDAGDGDTGANELQNFALLAGAFVNGGNVTIVGTLNSTASRNYRIEFFANGGVDSEGYSQGERYLGFASVTTDATGYATFTAALTEAAAVGEWITATATDLTTNSTSEFSKAMEVRSWAGTVGTQFIVTNTNDTGAGSLHQAILDANASAGLDAIVFNISSGLQTITPVLSLPTITEAVLVDARTQPGYVATPIIELNGGGGTNATGLVMDSTVDAGSIKGFVINRFQGYGIHLLGASNVIIQGNYIGTDTTGTAASANTAHGILFAAGGADNVIGGALEGMGNVISGNSWSGIAIEGSTGTTILNNYIGVNVDGSAAIANGDHGVYLGAGADNASIGDANGNGNIISGNADFGILLNGATGVTVQGNHIGVDATGAVDLGNGVDGIRLESGGNTIGGTTAGARNIISGNGQRGVFILNADNNVVQGNYIGTNAAGSAAITNGMDGVIIINANNTTIGGTAAGAGNLISGNTYKGIYNLSNTGTVYIQGNYIGTNADGTSAIANTLGGVHIESSSNVTVGGTVANARNIISGNAQRGLYILTSDTIVVQGNYIGTNVTGTAAVANAWGGIILDTATNVTIGGSAAGARNLVSGNTEKGIYLGSSSDVVIQGNYIGTNVDGTAALANLQHGIDIDNSDNNTIGGTAAAERNIISGNSQQGVAIRAGSTGNVVLGNYIGTDVGGTVDVGNEWNAIFIDSSTGNTIGGTAAGAGNVLSGNNNRGIYINNGSANTVQGNYIGTDATGAAALENTWHGIQIENSFDNVIGGTVAGARNVISGNGQNGIRINQAASTGNTIQGNYIGINAAGTAALANIWNGIHIYDNAGSTIIGGTTAGERNIISGNGARGIFIEAGSGSNTIQGNYIGTNDAGTAVVANVGDGVDINGSSDNTIGGLAAGAGNVISGNSQFGLRVQAAASTNNAILGNYIGTAADGMSGLGNSWSGMLLATVSNTTVQGNTVSGNASNGILISGGGANSFFGNYIGLDVAGTSSVSNGAVGIYMFAGSTGNIIGGTGVGEGNVISGNLAHGIEINASTGTVIQGNYIGTNAAGTASVQNSGDGIQLEAASNNTIIGGVTAGERNIISGNVGRGIYIQGSNNNTIQGNYIGTNAAGTAAVGNGIHGIEIDGGSSNNTIGGAAAGAGNVISGNGQYGISISGSDGDVIQGNYIGTNATGDAALGNGSFGIYIHSSSTNVQIGGSAAGAGNIIAASGSDGIKIRQSSDTTIQGNYIGTNADGDALGNTRQGIYLDDSATNTLIGGTGAGEGNVIAHNTLNGIATAYTGVAGNRILGNSIHSNGSLGIDIGEDGVTANDVGDGDAGTGDASLGNLNGMQNFPLVASAYINGVTLTIAGTLNSIASRTYRIEFFANSAQDGSGYGEGQIYLGYVDVTTDGSGNASYSFDTTGVSAGQWISATATDSTTNETSEFGQSVETVANNAPVISSDGGGSSASVSAYENSTAATTVAASDADTDTISFAISGGADSAKFSIDSSTGELTFVAAPDFENPGDADSDNTYVVEVTVSDGKGGTDVQTISVAVGNVNEAPAGADKTVTTNEDTDHTFTTADFGFTDGDGDALSGVKITTLPGAGTLTLDGVAVTAGDVIAVADITGGKLKFTPAANANGNGYASFTFQVQDDGGTANGGVDLDASANTITIDVTAVADDPTGSDTTVTTDEDTPYTLTVADFDFADVDGDTLAAVTITTLPVNGTLTLDGLAVTAGQSIAVADITGGKLVFTPATNAHGAGYDSFTFQVEDSSGATDGSANTITIDVTSVNDAPAGTDKTVTTNEDTDHTFTAADFGFSDSDGNALSGVKITTVPGAGSLTLDGVAVNAGDVIAVADITAGKLKFSPVADANGAGYASFTFQVQDDGGTADGGVDLDQSANTITIDVTSVNDAPAGTDKTVTTNEDTDHTFAAADFGFSDSDGNALSGVKITTVPGAGSLTLDGVAVNAGDVIAVADITAGKLKFSPVADANGAGYASFTFQVQDDGGTADGGVDLDQSANTITIDVTSVNDAPTGTDKTVTTNEDTDHTFTAADFGFSDSDGNALSGVKITTLPGAGSLTLDGVAVNAGDVIAVADITAGKLKFSPVADAHGAGYASFTFQVQDDGGTADGGVDLDQSANTITIDVTSVNDAPAGTDKTITTNEDTDHTFAAADFGFTDSDGNALSGVKITTLPGAGSLTLDGVAVNAGDVIAVADITAGKLKFSPVADANGAGYASFTFQVQDDGGTADGGVDLDQSVNTITIDVTSVNDAPAGTDKTITTNEDTDHTFAAADFGFSDSDGNALSGVKITTVPGAGTLTLDGVAVNAGDVIAVADITAGKLKFSPVADANGAGYASFTFQVQDDGGTADGGVDLDQSANAITIDVTPVNDAPSGADNTITTLEDTTHTFTAADFGFSDSNSNVLSAVKITTLPSAGGLTLDGVAVSAGQSITAADIAGGKLKFSPAANAKGAGYTSFTFQVQDDGGTADGGVDMDASANTITIDVTSVNDAPAGTDKTITTNEDTDHTFTAADFGFSDSDGNVLSGVTITTLPSAGSLTLNGVAVSAGQVITAADIAAGKLKFSPVADANGTGYASFTFQVQDDGGIANTGVDLDQSANTITIDVTSVNDAPAGADKTVTTNQDSAYTFKTVDFGFSDSDGNALQAIRIAGLPSTGTLTVNGIAVSAGDYISASAINLGLVKYTPGAGAATKASFAFQVIDDGGTANGGVNLDPLLHTMNVKVNLIAEPDLPATPPDVVEEPQNEPKDPPVITDPIDDTPDSSGGTTAPVNSGKVSAEKGEEKPARDASVVDQFIAIEQKTTSQDQAARYSVAVQELRLSVSSSDGSPLLNQANAQIALNQTQLALLQNLLEKVDNQGFSVISDGYATSDGDDVQTEQRQDQKKSSSHVEAVSARVVEIATTLTSLGTVWLVVRQSALAASLLASVPAWLRLDPLPVLGVGDDAGMDGDRLDIADHVFGGENTSPFERAEDT